MRDFALQPDGRILAVGDFQTYNDVARRHLARLNADGTLDTSFHSGVTTAGVQALDAVGLQCDGRILIGGDLESYDDIPRIGIARVTAGDTLTWTGAAGDMNWSNGANWSTSLAPTATDIAIIPDSSTVNLSGGNFSIVTLTVGANSTLTIAGGSNLAIEGGTNNGTIAGAGTLNFIGTALTNNGTISVAAVNANFDTICGNFSTGADKVLIGTGAFAGNVLNIASGITLALQSDHQFNQINVQGTLDATSRVVSLRGANPLQGAGSIIKTFSTIIFDGATAQTIPIVNYNNLTLNNAAGVNGFAGLVVQGLLRVQQGTFASSSGGYNNVQIDNGATLTGTNATTISVSGNWTNNGAFTANATPPASTVLRLKSSAARRRRTLTIWRLTTLRV